MNYLAVDLASKFSAAVILDRKGRVLCEFDSWKYSQIEFAELCANTAVAYDVKVALVEDLPYGLSMQAQTKPVTRLQGILIKAFHDLEMLDKLYFVNPVEWQKTFDGVYKGGAAGARAAAERLGFSQRHPIEMYADSIPPLGKAHAKARASVRANLKKASTDYDDAYLIGIYALLEHQKETLFTHKGVQSYKG